MRRVTAVRRPVLNVLNRGEQLVSNMESLTAGPPPAAAAGEPSAARKKVTGSMDAARNIQCGHYCNNDQSGRDRVEIQRQSGKAPTILKGGMRRRFSGQGEESLVRMIAAKCRDRMSCDIGGIGPKSWVLPN